MLDKGSRVPAPGDKPGRQQAKAGRVARFAERLRSDVPEVDEFTRARLEREVVQTWRTRPSRVLAVAMAERRRRDLWSQSAVPIAVSMAALIGAVVALQSSGSSGPVAPSTVAEFEVLLPNGGVQRGVASEGQLLRSGRHGRLEVAVGRSRIEAGRSTEFRFDRLDAEGLELTVQSGRVEVHFEPRVKGQQVMRISTRSARVRVVGTRFSVDVDGRGNTGVAVTEGVVEVTPRRGGEARMLHAGERLEVLLDPGDKGERAVRKALSARLAEVDDAPVPASDEASPASNEAPEEPRAQVEDAAADEHGDKHASRQQVAATLTRSRDLLREGRHGPARRALLSLARDGDTRAPARAEAWTLLAESYTAQGQVPKAKRAYEMASRAAPHHTVGHNATFALARLLERYTSDRDAAAVAYGRYLSRVPHGALAAQARRGLCRLGDAAACDQ